MSEINWEEVRAGWIEWFMNDVNGLPAPIEHFRTIKELVEKQLKKKKVKHEKD